MDYLELIITADHEELELITSELMELGVTSTEIRDNAVVDALMDRQNEYDWDFVDPSLVNLDRSKKPELRMYLDDNEQGRKLAEIIKKKYYRHKIEEKTVDDKDWVDSYKEHFKTVNMTDTLIVKPTWEEIEETGGITVIELDPGMAFGTGDHETTSMCAKLMEEEGCRGKSVLDVGTGSGILAIAAAALGSSNVLGIDLDPVAVKVASENVRKNHFTDRIRIIKGDLTEGVDEKFDMAAANLIAEIVCELTAHIKRQLNRGGCYISSGILKEKKEMVIESVEEAGMKVEKVLDDGEWSAIKARYE